MGLSCWLSRYLSRVLLGRCDIGRLLELGTNCSGKCVDDERGFGGKMWGQGIVSLGRMFAQNVF